MNLTIRKLFFILLFLGLFLMTLRPIVDPDFWWHLRTGQLIIQKQFIPRTDPFSYTNIGKPWIAHEWLTEVLIFALFQLGSYSLIIVTFSVIITGAFLLAYFRSSFDSQPYIAGFTVLLGALATAPTWGVRPQMISLFLSSLFLYLLDRYQKQKRFKTLLLLPFFSLLWVNIHAGYFLGLVIIFIFILGHLLDLIIFNLLKTGSFELPEKKTITNLCVVLGCCVLATLANPNGFHILIYPFQTLTDQAMQQFLQEWFSPDFHQLEWQPFAYYLLVFIGTGMLSKNSLSSTKILLTVLFGYAALMSMRHVPLFVIVSIPILSEQISSFVSIQSKSKSAGQVQKVIAPIFLSLSIIAICLRFNQVSQEQSKSEVINFPRTAVDWIIKNQPEGNLFNSYNWGGYLIWRDYLHYPVYIDGRADVYGAEFIYTYLNIYLAQPGWENLLDAYKINLVLVEPESDLSMELRHSVSWVNVFENKTSIIFERK
jgi:hypothetical protein